MTTTTNSIGLERFAVLLALALAPLAAGACSPVAPQTPTYANDVQPILSAHCARCHGPWGDGGGQWLDPTIAPRVPRGLCYLDSYDDRGDCAPVDGGAMSPTCQRGAHSCATLGYFLSFLPTMPPVPSAQLNDWEKDILKRWGADPRP